MDTEEEPAPLRDSPAPGASAAGTTGPRGGRATCDKCRRPERTCLCAFFPKEGERIRTPGWDVVIFQHKNESRQKNNSIEFLERVLHPDCFGVVRGQTQKQLLEKRPGALNLQDGQTYVVFPSEDAKTVADVVRSSSSLSTVLLTANGTGSAKAGAAGENVVERSGIDHESTSQEQQEQQEQHGNEMKQSRTLIVLDATWKYAKEMNARLDARIPRIKLTSEAERDLLVCPKESFVVRKPPGGGGSRSGGIDPLVENAPENATTSSSSSTLRMYSTAEAVALLLDALTQHGQRPAPAPQESPAQHQDADPRSQQRTPIYDAVIRPLRRHVEMQLGFACDTGGVKHRRTRPGYVENLYVGIVRAENNHSGVDHKGEQEDSEHPEGKRRKT